MKNSTKILIGVVVVALIGAGVYFGNTKLQKGSFVKIQPNIQLTNIPPSEPLNFKVNFLDKGAKFPFDLFPDNLKFYGETGVTAEFNWTKPNFQGISTGQLNKYRLVIKRHCKYPFFACTDGTDVQIFEQSKDNTFMSTLLESYTNYDFELYALGEDNTWSKPALLTNKETISKKLPVFPDESTGGWTPLGYGFSAKDNPNPSSKKYNMEIIWEPATTSEFPITGYRIAVRCIQEANGNSCKKVYSDCNSYIIKDENGLVGTSVCSNASTIVKNVTSYKLFDIKQDWIYSVAVYPINSYGEGPPRLFPKFKLGANAAFSWQ